MFHPFEQLTLASLEKLIKLNKIYLVSQTYKRSPIYFNPGKINLLFSDYDDPGLAKIHLNAVAKDKYAAVINLKNPVHLKKMRDILVHESGYQSWWCIVKDAVELKKKIDVQYKSKIRKYIEEHTTWRVGASEVIKPTVQVIFGELFVSIKRGSQVLRVKFEQLENS